MVVHSPCKRKVLVSSTSSGIDFFPRIFFDDKAGAIRAIANLSKTDEPESAFEHFVLDARAHTHVLVVVEVCVITHFSLIRCRRPRYFRRVVSSTLIDTMAAPASTSADVVDIVREYLLDDEEVRNARELLDLEKFSQLFGNDRP